MVAVDNDWSPGGPAVMQATVTELTSRGSARLVNDLQAGSSESLEVVLTKATLSDEINLHIISFHEGS